MIENVLLLGTVLGADNIKIINIKTQSVILMNSWATVEGRQVNIKLQDRYSIVIKLECKLW